MINGYYIGQRVIYNDHEIVKIDTDQFKVQPSTSLRQWIKLSNGVELYVDVNNLKPLPGGQL